MGNKKYTWEQIEEALSVAGVDSNSVRQALNEAVDYPNRAEQGRELIVIRFVKH
jgi:hypothetical protein